MILIGHVCSPIVSTLKFDDWKSITDPRVSRFRLQLKECGNNVNINMEHCYKSRVIAFMLAQASEYTWMKRKLRSNGAQTILKDLTFWENSI